MISISDIEMLLKTNAGVVFLMSLPGAGKSAIIKFIAKKNDYQFIDLRLSQMDQSEVTGLYDRVDTKTGEKYVVLRPQEWAVKANERPTLVNFDELNRASRETRNAALQILNERRCGWNFEFNDNVHFVACGNLGEEDNTDVDEFDDAMKNRLIPIKINVQEKAWIDQWLGWARSEEGNVHPSITNFIEKHPEMLFKKGNEDDLSFATARSWTFFSRLLTTNSIKSTDDLLNMAGTFSPMYIGGGVATAFIKHLNDTRHIKAEDILNRFKEIKESIKNLPRDRVSELLSEIGEKNINAMGKRQVANVIEFCKIIDQDEVVNYINLLSSNSFVKDDEHPEKNTNLILFLKEFNPIIQKIKDTYKEAETESEEAEKKE
jgi:hypothetical protein